jgi:ketosteroid isomerase-like protein
MGIDKKTNIVRDNISVHVNGNAAFADFDIHIYDPAGTVEGKANASLEKIGGEWKLVFLNVIDENSFSQTDDYWPF